jgi:hypothetical protein
MGLKNQLKGSLEWPQELLKPNVFHVSKHWDLEIIFEFGTWSHVIFINC